MNYIEVRYYLSSTNTPRTLLKFEPLNWDEDDKKIIRNTENWGVYTELSNDLQFVKDGRDLLEDIYNTEGTETEVILERWVYEKIDEGFVLDDKGYLDMKTFQLENERVSIQFLTGGLQSVIESQFDEPYELERQTDINGNEITDLEYDRIYWEGRRIFLESLLRTQEGDENFILANSVQQDNQLISSNVFLNVVFQSQLLPVNQSFNRKRFNLTQYGQIYVAQGIERPDTTAFFNIRTEDEGFDNTVHKISFSCKHGTGNYDQGSAANDYELVLAFSFYTFDGSVWSFNRRSILETQDINLSNRVFTVNTTRTIALLENEGVALTPYISRKTTANVFSFAQMNFFDIEAEIKLEQNSEFPPTEFDGIRLHDAVERMLEIYTGERNRIKSEYFTNSEFNNVLLSSGRQIRELEDARLSVELKDLYETNNYFNLGWSVETVDNKEKFVIEDKSYFFVDFPLFDLGEVSKLNVSCASEFLYKSGTFGNKKAGDYEEVQGIQEYNASTTYQTHLKTADNRYEVDADIRADLLGAELARRKNINTAPSEDTRYDNENFLFDCKPYETTKFTPKVWQDQLDQAPICYDPATAGNLLLTPFRSMERHSKTFGGGLTKYQDKFVRYSSGTGAVEVATKLENEPIRFENGNIINSELKPAIYEADYYEFEKPLDLDLRRKMKGYTLYNGKNIPNYNFLVKFTYKNIEYFGWIVEVGFNDPGQWKLIKKNFVNGL